MSETWAHPLTADETIEIPVRRSRRVHYLTALTFFVALDTYLFVSSGHDALIGDGRLAFHASTAGLGVYLVGALHLYYGILTGRSKLAVGQQGITLGDHHLSWVDVHDITRQPTSPVLRYLGLGPQRVRIQAHQRLRHIDVTRDHVKDLEAFGEWLRHAHEASSRA